MGNQVLVTASTKVPYLNAPKMVNQGVASRFTIKGEDGQGKIIVFLDAMGMESPLNINQTMTFDLTNKIDSHNLQALKLRLSIDPELAKTVKIIDKEADAESQNNRDLATAAAMAVINSIKDDTKTIQAIYRRKFGSVDGVSEPLILSSLFTLAKEYPNELIQLNESVKDEEGVFYDLLLENGIIRIQEGLVMASNGNVLAKSKDSFTLMARENAAFREQLQFTLNKIISDKSSSVKPENLLPSLLKNATKVSDAGNEEIEMNGSEVGLSEADIDHLVKLAVKAGYFVEVKSGTFAVPGGAEYDRKGLFTFYKKNPANALELKQELVVTGIFVEKTA